MELTLTRCKFSEIATIGNLTIDGKPECFVLEDCDRHLESHPEAKIYGKTAIPRGRYQVVITMSNRFKTQLPLLLDVPGFAGIRIHPGNTDKDTEGCLLPGARYAKDAVLNSKKAFVQLYDTIASGLKGGEVWITVK